jgi:hypothetical protein
MGIVSKINGHFNTPLASNMKARPHAVGLLSSWQIVRRIVDKIILMTWKHIRINNNSLGIFLLLFRAINPVSFLKDDLPVVRQTHRFTPIRNLKLIQNIRHVVGDCFPA